MKKILIILPFFYALSVSANNEAYHEQAGTETSQKIDKTEFERIMTEQTDR